MSSTRQAGGTGLGNWVPHLRDSLIVVKLGVRAKTRIPSQFAGNSIDLTKRMGNERKS
jgi:hypothetical protein